MKIAIFAPIGPEFSIRYLEGAIRYANQHDEIVILDRAFQPKDTDPLKDRNLEFDAALVRWDGRSEWIDQLLDLGIPLINVSGRFQHPKLPGVAFNPTQLIDAGIEHLKSLGKQSLAFIGTDLWGNSTLKWAKNYFLDQCKRKGLEAESVCLGASMGYEDRLDYLDSEQSSRLDEWFADLGPSKAVLCQDDDLARKICEHAEAHGIEIPERLAVLGVGDYLISRIPHPTISTIPYPQDRVSEKVIELLHLAVSKGRQIPKCTQLDALAVIARESSFGSFGSHSVYHRCHKMIQVRACEGLTVSELVAESGVSQRTFSKRFHELFGVSPGTAIRHARIARAKELLKNSDASINQVGEACGFAESGKFSFFFKRETGLTPTDYRSQTSQKS